MKKVIFFNFFLCCSFILLSQENKLDTNLNQEPIFTISLDDLENSSEEQEFSGLLQSSKDVFSSIAAYNFSSSRFRPRGYDSQNQSVLINGVSLNNAETGRAIWAHWGGLNDITRYQQGSAGVSYNPFGFGGIGGYSNIGARASDLRAGTRFSSAIANRSYSSRFMVTNSTGMLDNGWAISASASGRFSNEGYVEGTFYSAASYFLSVEKKINNKHSLGLIGFGAPTVQGKQGIVVDEIHDILDDNFYNPYWGYQNGEKRNSRVRNTHKPMFLLSHYWDYSTKSKITSTASYSFGKGSNTRLNWYNAENPNPTYYRYLPSYFNQPGQESEYQLTLYAWQNYSSVSQINWDNLYFANSKNLYTVDDANGIEGNSITGNRAKYIVEEYFNNHSQYAWNTNWNYKWNDNLNLDAGINLSSYISSNFKEIKDLLGADFWVDVDQFAEREFVDPNAAQSNLEIPNHLVGTGDRFGYDYDINIQKYDVFSQLERKGSKLDSYLALRLSGSKFWRTGNVKNGLFPTNSLGNSEKLSFVNPGVKAGLLYKFTGRHMLQLNTAYLSRSPLSTNVFTSPRTRNDLVQDIKSETIKTADINYLVRFSGLKLRMTAYYTLMEDKTWSRSFYHDELKSFVNYIMTGVDQSFMGVEIGSEIKLSSTFTSTFAFATGDFIYNSRPNAIIVQDNSTELLAQDRTVYIKNYKVGGIPQTNATLGIKYNSPKFWFAGLTANYFANTYLDVNPDRRTFEALDGFVTTDPQVDAILDQTKLNPGLSLDLFIGKSWKIKYGEYIRFNVNVSNLLDYKDYATGGFEQLRYDSSDIDRFPSLVGYMYGRSYFAMISYIF
jgi:hypothetical protein